MFGDIHDDLLTESLAKMCQIRESELVIAENSVKGTFKTPVHLAIGQEAIAVAVSKFLIKGDLVFGNHRSHAHYLSLGGDLLRLFEEILGKESGTSGGRGGSMHLVDLTNGLAGTMPIVAGTIPIAAGAALALKRTSLDNISVSYFGDGATEEGVFHETLNLASNYQIPLVFICENNLMSSHLHISERQKSESMLRFANANYIESVCLNGNNFLELIQELKSIFQYVRTTRKPFFIEARTYRLYGHVGGQVDEEIGLYRKEDLEKWSQIDPLHLLSKYLINNNVLSDTDFEKLVDKTRNQVRDVWDIALKTPSEHRESIYKNTFFEEAK